MNVFDLIEEYISIVVEKEKSSNIFNRINTSIILSLMKYNILETLDYEYDIFELVKTYRILSEGKFKDICKFNKNIVSYSFNGIRGLDIYIKHKYIIKFRQGYNEKYIYIEGNHPDKDKTLFTVPEDIEREVHTLILREVEDILINIATS